MREIKFRAWKPHTSLNMKPGMYRVNTIDWYDKPFQGKTGEVFYRSHNTSDYTEDIELMQFTGLKDKNGVEIYEGDILQRTYTNGGSLPKHFSVKWDKTGWNLKTYSAIVNTLEIIGNIYENPELLK